MTIASRRVGHVTFDMTWEEANQTLAAQQARSLLLHSLLAGPCSPELRAYLADAIQTTASAEGRLGAALMGDRWEENENRLAWGDR